MVFERIYFTTSSHTCTGVIFIPILHFQRRNEHGNSKKASFRPVAHAGLMIIPIAAGKRHYESFTAETKKESEYLAAQFAMEKERRRHMSSAPLRDAITEYVKTSDAILSPTTIQGYQKIQKYAFSDIMDIPLKKLSNQILQDAVNQEAKRPNGKRKSKEPISAKTVHNEYGLVNGSPEQIYALLWTALCAFRRWKQRLRNYLRLTPSIRL